MKFSCLKSNSYYALLPRIKNIPTKTLMFSPFDRKLSWDEVVGRIHPIFLQVCRGPVIRKESLAFLSWKKNRMLRRSNWAFETYKWSRLSISFVAFKVAFTRSTIVFYVVLRKFTLNNLFCDCVLLCGGLVLPSFTKFESCKNVFKSSSAFRHHFGEPIWCLAIYERNYIHNYKYR